MMVVAMLHSGLPFGPGKAAKQHICGASDWPAIAYGAVKLTIRHLSPTSASGQGRASALQITPWLSHIAFRGVLAFRDPGPMAARVSRIATSASISPSKARFTTG